MPRLPLPAQSSRAVLRFQTKLVRVDFGAVPDALVDALVLACFRNSSPLALLSIGHELLP